MTNIKSEHNLFIHLQLSIQSNKCVNGHGQDRQDGQDGKNMIDIYNLYFPGHLCTVAFAILAMFINSENSGPTRDIASQNDH